MLYEYGGIDMIVIRDDDTSFWTSPDELKTVYGNYLDKGYKISLAVVPCSYNLVNRGNRKQLYIGSERRYLSDNEALIDYLTPYVKSGQIEIMQHGYDHSYSILLDDKPTFLSEEVRKRIGNSSSYTFLPECIYKSEAVLLKELAEGRRLLEDIFKVPITSFVPPSNALRRKSARILDEIGLDVSGTITNSFNRPIDLYSINVYMSKIWWRIRKNSGTYPYVMHYKHHNELNCHAFTPSMDIQKFKKDFLKTKSLNCDFVLATHYWEILKYQDLHSEFDNFMTNSIKGEETALLKTVLHQGR